jgi:hypothetical protein
VDISVSAWCKESILLVKLEEVLDSIDVYLKNPANTTHTLYRDYIAERNPSSVSLELLLEAAELYEGQLELEQHPFDLANAREFVRERDERLVAQGVPRRLL